MKIAAATAVLAFAPLTANAFVLPQQRPAFGTALSVEATPAQSAVEAALEATKKYGVASSEAQVLWDAVEEMRAADNSEAMKGGFDTECDVEEVDEACREYDEKMTQLSSLVEEYNDKLSSLKQLTTDLSSLKMTVNAQTKASDSPELTAKIAEATAEAKAATAEFGAASVQAQLAWETVEEVASSGLQNAMGGGLDQECLVEQAMDACTALEELNKALNLNK